MIRAFLSFVEEDLNLVNLFRGQAKNGNSDLEFADYSIKEPFDSTNAAYIAQGISAQLRLASITVCLYGPTTYTSKWVEWELRKSLELGKPIMGVAAACEAVRLHLGLQTLETRGRDALDVHEISVASLRDVIDMVFRAGYKAAGGTFPKPIPTDPSEMLATLRITKSSGRKTGGAWVHGTIAGHAFEALVFPEHATDAAFELDNSRISKLWIRSEETGEVEASFERGWDMKPATEIAKAIVDLLAAGLAERTFGH